MADKKYHYATNCVCSTAGNISRMIDTAHEISYATFRKYVNWQEVSEIFGYALHPKKGLMLKNDWAASFYKGKYCGVPCVYMRHSAIEYVFLREN